MTLGSSMRVVGGSSVVSRQVRHNSTVFLISTAKPCTLLEIHITGCQSAVLLLVPDFSPFDPQLQNRGPKWAFLAIYVILRKNINVNNYACIRVCSDNLICGKSCPLYRTTNPVGGRGRVNDEHLTENNGLLDNLLGHSNLNTCSRESLRVSWVELKLKLKHLRKQLSFVPMRNGSSVAEKLFQIYKIHMIESH